MPISLKVPPATDPILLKLCQVLMQFLLDKKLLTEPELLGYLLKAGLNLSPPSIQAPSQPTTLEGDPVADEPPGLRIVH